MNPKDPVGADPISAKKPMNKIEKLIDELCQEGVEFKPLLKTGTEVSNRNQDTPKE